MEQEAEIVAAAHAVRAWVLAQRVTWAEQSPLSIPHFDPAPLTTSVAAADAAAVLERDAAAFEPSPAIDLPPIELSSLESLLRIPETVTSVYVEAPRRLLSAALLRRAAVLLAACAIVGSGGYAAWSRYGATPRIGTAVIASTPAGAEVYVDGARAGTTPLRLDIEAGRHDVELRFRGQRRTEQVTIERGAETPVAWAMRRVGTIQIASTPAGARVTIDGHERGVTPLELNDLPEGAHVVQFESEEGSVTRRVDVDASIIAVVNESIYPGWVRISAPFDVVLVDGAAAVPLDARNSALLKPGPHTIRIENRTLGFAESREITIEPGGTTQVDVVAPLSSLTVTGPAGAEVFVDGEKVGQVPLMALPVKMGTREVRVVETSGLAHRRSVTITPQPATVDIPVEP